MVHKKGRNYSKELDQKDPLKVFRKRFMIPKDNKGNDLIYFCGNSLGLQPSITKSYIDQILTDWSHLGVESWFEGDNPWIAYCDSIKISLSKIVGANPNEIAVMNSLSVNLHLLMISFYRPAKNRFKIIMERDAFPSDKYIIESQVRFHGYDPNDAIIRIDPKEGEQLISNENIRSIIESEGESAALILLGGVNYITGQKLDIALITAMGHAAGCIVGFDLAHASGNVVLHLHQHQVDFAAWCNYKYINGGPGSVGAIFVHQQHHDKNVPRLEGWWGNRRDNRFLMQDHFDPEIGAEAWVTSTPPLIAIAALKASLSIFDEVSMSQLVTKSRLLTGYLEYLINDLEDQSIEIITPKDPNDRGAQLSIKVRRANKELFNNIIRHGVICDWREPDVIRIAPVPLYNSYEDVFDFVQILQNLI